MTPLDGPSRLRQIQGPTCMCDNYRIVKAMCTLSHECTLTDQNTLPVIILVGRIDDFSGPDGPRFFLHPGTELKRRPSWMSAADWSSLRNTARDRKPFLPSFDRGRGELCLSSLFNWVFISDFYNFPVLVGELAYFSVFPVEEWTYLHTYNARPYAFPYLRMRLRTLF